MNSAANNLKFHLSHGHNEITCGRSDVATEADDSIPCCFKGENETELKSNANKSIKRQKCTRGAFKLITITHQGLRSCQQLSCLMEFPVDKTRTPLLIITQEKKD
jgi:hypothetical protein